MNLKFDRRKEISQRGALLCSGLSFVMSGYLRALSAKEKSEMQRGQPTFAAFQAFAVKMAKRLLVPYSFFSAAALGVKLVVAHMSGGSLREQAEPALHEFVTFLGTGTLWFLPALSRLLERRISLEPVTWIGRNLLIIMCTHNEWLLVPVFSAGAGGRLGGICRFLNRYLPWALGKNTYRTRS